MQSLQSFLLRLLRHRLPSFVLLEKHTANISESTHSMSLFLCFGLSCQFYGPWMMSPIPAGFLATCCPLLLNYLDCYNNHYTIAKTIRSSTICSASTLPTERCQCHHPVRNPTDEIVSLILAMHELWFRIKQERSYYHIIIKVFCRRIFITSVDKCKIALNSDLLYWIGGT